jgi:hypothetical protein
MDMSRASRCRTLRVLLACFLAFGALGSATLAGCGDSGSPSAGDHPDDRADAPTASEEGGASADAASDDGSHGSKADASTPDTSINDASINDASGTDTSIADASGTDASIADAPIPDAPIADAPMADSASCDGQDACGPLSNDGGGVVVLFGGDVVVGVDSGWPNGIFGDTWTFDGTSWTQRHPEVSPPARGHVAAATLGKEVVLFGGYDGTTWLNDTWTLDGESWRQVVTPTAPAPRADMALATLGGRVILFGGYSVAGGFSDTWAFDGAGWTELHPSSDPPAFGYPSLTATGGALVLFGQVYEGTANVPTAETWIFDGTTWSEPNLAVMPPARYSTSMATLGNTAVLYGGLGNTGGELTDTWFFERGELDAARRRRAEHGGDGAARRRAGAPRGVRTAADVRVDVDVRRDDLEPADRLAGAVATRRGGARVSAVSTEGCG